LGARRGIPNRDGNVDGDKEAVAAGGGLTCPPEGGPQAETRAAARIISDFDARLVAVTPLVVTLAA